MITIAGSLIVINYMFFVALRTWFSIYDIPKGYYTTPCFTCVGCFVLHNGHFGWPRQPGKYYDFAVGTG